MATRRTITTALGILLLVGSAILLAACLPVLVANKPTRQAGATLAANALSEPEPLSERARAQVSTENINGIAITPDGEYLAAADDSNAYLYHTDDFAQVWVAQSEQPWYAVAISPDGTLGAGGFGNGDIVLWDVQTQTPFRTLSARWGSIYTLAIAPDGSQVAAGSGYTVSVWDVASGRQLHLLRGHSKAIFSVAYSPDGALIASGSDDGTAKVWDADSGELLYTLDSHPGEVRSVAFSPDGATLAAGSRKGTIVFWDTATGEMLGTLPPSDTQHATGLEANRTTILSLAFSPDGSRLATGSREGTITLWDVEARELLDVQTEHRNWVLNLAFTQDGKTLASASWDGMVILWKVNT